MAKSVYKTAKSHVIFAEDSDWASAGSPSGSDYVDKVTTFEVTLENNPILNQGIGEGLNATNSINGVFDVDGTINWELTDPSFLQYCFIAERSGAGTAGDPYELQETDEIGYSSAQTPSLTLYMEHEGGSNDDALRMDGVFFPSVTVSGEQGQAVTVNSTFIGRYAQSSTSVSTYTAPTNRPFTWVDSSFEVGSDVAAEVIAFSLTCDTEFSQGGKRRELGNRFILQPAAAKRRYTFELRIRLHYDDTSSTLSGREARALILDGTTSGTTPSTGGENTLNTCRFKLIEGAASGDRIVWFELQNSYFKSVSEPVELDNGDIELTITGTAESGVTDSSVQVITRWWTIA